VIGLGYIGLPTASLLATKGFKVHGVDVNPKVVETISRGDIHIYEPDLDILVKSAVHSGNFTASKEPIASDVYIIAVPTPFQNNHNPDISYVESAIRSLAPHLKPGNLIILESTSPVGTTEKIGEWLTQLRPDLKIPSRSKPMSVSSDSEPIRISHCPERVLPGQILKELVDNDRIVGGVDPASTDKARIFYEQFVNGTIHATDARTAELAKLTENAFRDVNIAFANELSLICDKLEVNVWNLIKLANYHPRVNILQPGPGVGGHCIAVDPWFIVDSAPEQARLIRTAREVNDAKPGFVIKKVLQKAAGLQSPVIACLGLSFKADIEDLRESPSVEIVKKLAEEKVGKIIAVEPHIQVLPSRLCNLPNLELGDLAAALKRANIIILLVNHRAFSEIDWNILKEKVIIDTRGVLH